MSYKPIRKWGGARQGAGRPKQSLSVRQVNSMLRKARKWAKQTGYDVDDFLLAVIYGDKEKLGVDSISMKDRIACAKIWKTHTMINFNGKNADATEPPGSVIYLPPMMPDPALEIVKRGNVSNIKKN